MVGRCYYDSDFYKCEERRGEGRCALHCMGGGCEWGLAGWLARMVCVCVWRGGRSETERRVFVCLI